MTNHPNYKITFILDSAAMITVHTPKRGVVEVSRASRGLLFRNLKYDRIKLVLTLVKVHQYEEIHPDLVRFLVKAIKQLEFGANENLYTMTDYCGICALCCPNC